MTEKTGYIFRRILETVGNILISSGIIYLLIVGEIIPSSRGMYIISFGISTILFLAFSYRNLRNHFWSIKFDITKYLIVNLSIFALLAAVSFIALKYGSDSVYTAFFGYTKPFRQMFNISAIESSVIFCALYLSVIISVLIKTLFFDWEYKDICYRIAQKQINEENENL